MGWFCRRCNCCCLGITIHAVWEVTLFSHRNRFPSNIPWNNFLLKISKAGCWAYPAHFLNYLCAKQSGYCLASNSTWEVGQLDSHWCVLHVCAVQVRTVKVGPSLQLEAKPIHVSLCRYLFRYLSSAEIFFTLRYNNCSEMCDIIAFVLCRTDLNVGSVHATVTSFCLFQYRRRHIWKHA